MTANPYFPETEPCLAAILDDFLASLAANIQSSSFSSNVCVLLLAGGYGRGEGGVFLSAPSAAPQLYNDLEFYLILRDAAEARPVEEWCARESHRGDEALGIEVEFKILREGAFRAAQPSMFYYDLLAAHRVVWGAPEFAESVAQPLRDPELIPLHEATRLLFNRGTGLFFFQCGIAPQGRARDQRIHRTQPWKGPTRPGGRRPRGSGALPFLVSRTASPHSGETRPPGCSAGLENTGRMAWTRGRVQAAPPPCASAGGRIGAATGNAFGSLDADVSLGGGLPSWEAVCIGG